MTDFFSRIIMKTRKKRKATVMKNISCPAKKAFNGSKKERAAKIAKRLKDLYPEAECALAFQNDPFRLIVMARLSAQCTDKRVNEVSVLLFDAYPDVFSMAKAPLSHLEALCRPCGLYRTKARQISQMCQILVRDFKGQIPREKETLLALPGVGEKIANLMLGDCFDDPHIVADTHCIRLSGRLGLVSSKDPKKVTKELEAIVPKQEQSDFCHRLITLGREFCRAQNPHCETCPMRTEESMVLDK